MSVLTSSQILTAGQKEVIITCIRQPRACPMADPSGKVQWQILQVFLELEPRQRRRVCHTEGKTCRLVTLVHHSKCSWHHKLHKICRAYPLLCHNGTEPGTARSRETRHTADHSIEQEITFSGKLTLKGRGSLTLQHWAIWFPWSKKDAREYKKVSQSHGVVTTTSQDKGR